MNRRSVTLQAFAASCALTLLSCLGVCAVSSGLEEWCDDIPGLNPAQVEMCNGATGLQTALHTGMQQAVEKCKYEFKSEQWDCSMLGSSSLLARAPEGTKEAAFVSALTAAGVALHISLSCQQGSSRNCSSDVHRSFCSIRGSKGFGSTFAFQFLAAASASSQFFSRADWHNVRVGLKILRQSSSDCCAVQNADDESCTPLLEKAAEILKRKYDNSQRVEIAASAAGKTVLRLKENPAKRAKSGDLVFLNESPNYCMRIKHAGIAGTQGRVCRGNGCGSLCCGRGYSTHHYNTTSPCRVRFQNSGGRIILVYDECSKAVSENRCN